MLFLCIGIVLFIPWSTGSLTNEQKVIACDDLNNIYDHLFKVVTNIKIIQEKVQMSNSFGALISSQLSIIDKRLNILTNVEAKVNELDTKLDTVLIKINKIENDVEHLKFSFEKSDIKILNEINQTRTIEKKQDELKFKINNLDTKLNLVPLRLDEMLVKINVLEESSKRINNKLEKQNENELLENVLNKINNVENTTEYLKNSFDKSVINNITNIEKLIEKCNESKKSNKSITITEDSLILSNPFDYTLCKNKSGIFKFHTNEITLTEERRDYGVRLCHNGWLVIQNRNSYEYQENFNRSWNDYKHGFGDLRKEFWFGNDFLHRLSYQIDLILGIELESFDNVTEWVEYATLRVDSEYENYRLNLGNFKGTIIDSMNSQNNMKFSTFDKDNDLNSGNCAVWYESGWWFNSCHATNLNGLYRHLPEANPNGIVWYNGEQFINYKSVKMMVKPKESVIQFSDLTYNTYNPL